ncbi:hypothetical protein ACWF9B_01160 [Streptomyces sp. NPDC055089]
MPEGAQGHWCERIEHLRRSLTDAGFAVRSRSRLWNPYADEYADFLVYVVAPSLSIPE